MAAQREQGVCEQDKPRHKGQQHHAHKQGKTKTGHKCLAFLFVRQLAHKNGYEHQVIHAKHHFKQYQRAQTGPCRWVSYPCQIPHIFSSGLAAIAYIFIGGGNPLLMAGQLPHGMPKALSPQHKTRVTSAGRLRNQHCRGWLTRHSNREGMPLKHKGEPKGSPKIVLTQRSAHWPPVPRRSVATIRQQAECVQNR